MNWTEIENEKLRKLFPLYTNKQLAKIFNRTEVAIKSRGIKFKLKKTYAFDPRQIMVDEASFIKDFPIMLNKAIGKKYNISKSTIIKTARRLKLQKTEKHMQSSCRYQPGHKPWNTGTKGICKANSGSFQSGNKPANTKSNLEITTRHDTSGNNYKWIRIQENEWEMLHIYNWIQEYGEIPEGKIVVFKNGNSMDCEINNLEAISREDHIKRNSGSLNLPDTMVAFYLFPRNPKLRNEVMKFPHLLDAKRASIMLNRTINEEV